MMTALGRPRASETALEDARDELTALRAEAREAAAIAPLARYVHRRVAIDCDPQTEQLQLAVVRFLERAARRGGA